MSKDFPAYPGHAETFLKLFSSTQFWIIPSSQETGIFIFITNCSCRSLKTSSSLKVCQNSQNVAHTSSKSPKNQYFLLQYITMGTVLKTVKLFQVRGLSSMKKRKQALENYSFNSWLWWLSFMFWSKENAAYKIAMTF